MLTSWELSPGSCAMRGRSGSWQAVVNSPPAHAQVPVPVPFHFQGVFFQRFIMNHASKSIGVSCAICCLALLIVTPELVAQNRFAGMQNMSMQRPPIMPSMMAPTVSGQMMPGQMMSPNPTVFPGFNPNPRFGNFGGFGTPFSPFAGPFGSTFGNPYGLSGLGGLYGGGYGLGSLLGQYGNPVGAAYAPTQVGANGGNAAAQKGAGDKAAQQKEKAEDERAANRRKQVDEMQNDREKAIQEEQRRSRENPTLSEIVSGKSLNDLLDDFRKLGAGIDSSKEPKTPLPLDKAGLEHINVTRGVGNIALLKNGGRLNWPAALSGPESRDARDRLSAQVSEIVGRMTRGSEVEQDVLLRMTNDVEQFRAQLQRNAGDLSFQTFVEAKRFLQNLNDSIVALRQPDAMNHLTGKYALSAPSVLGLVKNMNDNSLRFAAAIPGDESAYVALRDALASCYRAVQLQSGAR
jgi:hypothetical protein